MAPRGDAETRRRRGKAGRATHRGYSTVTLFARLRGWSTSFPMKVAT